MNPKAKFATLSRALCIFCASVCLIATQGCIGIGHGIRTLPPIAFYGKSTPVNLKETPSVPRFHLYMASDKSNYLTLRDALNHAVDSKTTAPDHGPYDFPAESTFLTEYGPTNVMTVSVFVLAVIPLPSGGREKSRTFYLWQPEHDRIYTLTLYKSQAEVLEGDFEEFRMYLEEQFSRVHTGPTDTMVGEEVTVTQRPFAWTKSDDFTVDFFRESKARVELGLIFHPDAQP